MGSKCYAFGAPAVTYVHTQVLDISSIDVHTKGPPRGKADATKQSDAMKSNVKQNYSRQMCQQCVKSPNPPQFSDVSAEVLPDLCDCTQD